MNKDPIDLDQFREHRDNTLKILSQDPREFAVTLYYQDNGQILSRYFNDDSICCLGNMDANENNHQCMIGTLSLQNTDQDNDINTYLVDVAEYSDYQIQPIYILKASFMRDFDMNYRDKPGNVIEQLSKKRDIVKTCLYKNELISTDVKYIGSDLFTNDTIIAYIIDYIMTNFSTTLVQNNNSHPYMATYTKYYTSSVCNQHIPGPLGKDIKTYGLNLIEYCDLGTLYSIGQAEIFLPYRIEKTISDFRKVDYTEISPYDLLTPNRCNFNEPNQFKFTTMVINPIFISLIIKQVIVTLAFLQDTIYFNHGDPRVNNILISSDPCNVSYLGVDIDAPFTCKITNFDTSALSLKLGSYYHRFYHRIWLSDRFIDTDPFVTNINQSDNTPYYSFDDNFDIISYNRVRQIGFPFYQTFDTYIFIISLLMIPEVFYEVFSNKDLQTRVWDILWFPDDNNLAFTRLDRFIQRREQNSLSNIIILLRNLKLKCNITHFLVDSLVSL